jgi:hypothetical protein
MIGDVTAKLHEGLKLKLPLRKQRGRENAREEYGAFEHFDIKRIT